MSSLTDLQSTVEEIRSERFSELPDDLVREILDVEERHIDDRGPAPRRVEAIIDAWIEANS